MNPNYYVIILVVIGQPQASSLYLEIPDELECVKDETKRSGLCSIDVGDKCCEG